MEHGSDQLFEGREVTVMGAEPARQLPYPFHGVQLRTVGWQELEPKPTAMFPQPRLEKPGVVPAGIVQNEDQHSAFSAVAQELFQERMECHCIELLSPACDQTAVAGTDRPEHAETFAGGRLKDHRVCILRRYPHGAT